MEISNVELVKIVPKKIWAEKDMMGTVHIKMQHEGCEAFDFIQINYDWAHTDNSHQHYLTQEILKLLGANNDTGKE